MENRQKTSYIPCLLEIVRFSEEDVIRTSYVDDNYGNWDDDNANPIGDIF